MRKIILYIVLILIATGAAASVPHFVKPSGTVTFYATLSTKAKIDSAWMAVWEYDELKLDTVAMSPVSTDSTIFYYNYTDTCGDGWFVVPMWIRRDADNDTFPGTDFLVVKEWEDSLDTKVSAAVDTAHNAAQLAEASRDTASAVHSAVEDSSTAIHSALEDSASGIHTDLLAVRDTASAIHSALEDSASGIHTDLLAVRDTSSAVHSALEDSASSIHTDLLAVRDTASAVHTALEDSAADLHAETENLDGWTPGTGSVLTSAQQETLYTRMALSGTDAASAFAEEIADSVLKDSLSYQGAAAGLEVDDIWSYYLGIDWADSADTIAGHLLRRVEDVYDATIVTHNVFSGGRGWFVEDVVVTAEDTLFPYADWTDVTGASLPDSIANARVFITEQSERHLYVALRDDTLCVIKLGAGSAEAGTTDVQVIESYIYTPPTPSDTSLCVVYSTLWSAGLVPAGDSSYVAFELTTPLPPSFHSTGMVTSVKTADTTDSNGDWAVSVVPNSLIDAYDTTHVSRYRVHIWGGLLPDSSVFTVTVPDSETVMFENCDFY